MKLLIYNIAYGTGLPGGARGVFSAHRYLRTPEKVISSIAEFINKSGTDVAGLVEIDTGSFRTGYLDQVAYVAERLPGFTCSAVKYGSGSVGRCIPILRKANC